ncbi:restriction endonuclease subunit S [Bacillus bombysepticus]
MINTVQSKSKGFSVLFKDFKYWQVTSLRTAVTNRCFWPTVRLGDICKIRTEVIPDSEIYSGNIHLLDKISFEEGKIHSGKRKETKMKLYRAIKGDIVVSKINALKKAIGVVDGIHDIGITSHFRSLVPDKSKVDTIFLWTALRSEYCVNQFSIETGGIGKGEISEERLLNVEVPFPPLSIQLQITNLFQTAEKDLEDAEKSYQDIMDSLNTLLYSHFNKSEAENALESKVLCLGWHNISAWNVQSARAAAFKIQNPHFKPLRDYLEESTILIKPWEDPDKDWPVYGVNNKDGVFFSYYQKGNEFNAPYKKIAENWFFHNPTRASVGSLGIVPCVPEDALTSPEYQVWKIKKGISPEYMAALISTPFFINLIQYHRVGAVKQRLYVENLMDIHIPMLSEKEQESVVQKRKNALIRIKDTKQNMSLVKKKIEALVIGRKKNIVT